MPGSARLKLQTRSLAAQGYLYATQSIDKNALAGRVLATRVYTAQTPDRKSTHCQSAINELRS